MFLNRSHIQSAACSLHPGVKKEYTEKSLHLFMFELHLQNIWLNC